MAGTAQEADLYPVPLIDNLSSEIPHLGMGGWLDAGATARMGMIPFIHGAEGPACAPRGPAVSDVLVSGDLGGVVVRTTVLARVL